MRFNVVTVPEETELVELWFTQTDIKDLKAAGCTTVGDVLHAFSDRTIFRVFTDKKKCYEIALTICNPELTENRTLFRFAYLNEESAAQTQLNAALLMLSEEAQNVLKRFMVTIPEQLGYVLNKSELKEVLDASYQQGTRVYELLDEILRGIDELYYSGMRNFEVNIRGQFAAETYNLEIQDVFQEEEFKRFRQYCDDIGAVWLKNLAGFSPELLRKSIGADQELINSVIQRCKRIEQGDAKKFTGVSSGSYKTKLTESAKRAAVKRHRMASSCSASEKSIYGENELVRYTFIDPVLPSYMLMGTPLAFSYGYDVFMCSSWKDLLVKVLRFLCDEYPEKMKKLVEEKICNSLPILLHRDHAAETLSCPRRVTQSIIAETDFSNETIFDFVKNLISKCKIPVQEFSITCLCSLGSIIGRCPEADNMNKQVMYKESNSSTQHHLITNNFSKRRIEFEEWLEKEKACSYMDVQECVTSVNTASDWARDLDISKEDFFDIDDTVQMVQYCLTLLENRKFFEYERSMHDRDFGAINLLIEFCMDLNVHAGSEDDSGEPIEAPDLKNSRRTGRNRSQKEQLFEQWLSDNENLDETQVNRCIEAIYIASDWAKELTISTRNLFDIKDAEKLVRVTDALLADPQFARYDTSKKMAFTKAIDMLVDCYYDNE